MVILMGCQATEIPADGGGSDSRCILNVAWTGGGKNYF